MTKQKVECSACGACLERRPINPNTKMPIKNFFCDTECKGIWQRQQREALGFTKDWLFAQYVIQGKDANQIAREIGRDGKRVWEWLRDYGIETRPRGYRHDHLPKDGQAFLGRKHSEESKEKIRQAALADGRVPWGKGNDPYWKGKTGADHPSFKGGLTPERQSFYSSQEWVDAVKKVWQRDDAICQRCGTRHNTKTSRGTFHIHHIVSFMVRELRAEISNLVLLCKGCHKWVHSKSNTEKLFIKKVKK